MERGAGHALRRHEQGPGAGPLLLGADQHRDTEDTGSTGTSINE